jgi:galactitol-specific phosphotransferase system IIC component
MDGIVNSKADKICPFLHGKFHGREIFFVGVDSAEPSD